MNIEVFVLEKVDEPLSEELLFERPNVNRFILELNANTTIGELEFKLREEFGDLYFLRNLVNFGFDERSQFYIYRNDILYFNSPMCAITVSEYIRYCCDDGKEWFVFSKESSQIGGDGEVIDWFLTMYSTLNQYFITNPLMLAFVTPISMFVGKKIGEDTKKLYRWAKLKLQKYSTSPDNLLKAIYSRSRWTLDEFDSTFQIHDKALSKRVLLAFGFRKQNKFYVLETKKTVSDFKIQYIEAGIFEIENL